MPFTQQLFFPQVDEQLTQLQHEKADFLKRLEEDQEDLNELMKKHKALIAQVCLCECLMHMSLALWYVSALNLYVFKNFKKNLAT